jgi:cytochrome c peroxidase
MLWVLLLICRVLAAQPVDEVTRGKWLFYDVRLSADGSVACVTCHIPERAFSENRALSIGVYSRQGDRHAPSLIARGVGNLQFWDGRAETLEKQVLEPIVNPKEMGMTVPAALARIRSDYPDLSADGLARALAAYVRTIRSVNSPLDRYLAGDGGALSPLEREGLSLFRDRARCYICHAGPNLTDEGFHNTGVAWRNGRLLDEGRFRVTGRPYHKGAFKTPTLREIARTPPYMHDGSLATLEEVIELYDRGGNRNEWLDENIVPLHLSVNDKRALAAFLRSLSGSVEDGVARP